MRSATRHPALIAAVLTAAFLAMLLVGAAPAASAAEASSAPAVGGLLAAAETDEGAEEGGAAGEDGGEEGAAGEEGEREKIEPPLSFDDPQDLLGWVILGVAAIAAAAAGRNVVQQMRGERPKADGTWRPR